MSDGMGVTMVAANSETRRSYLSLDTLRPTTRHVVVERERTPIMHDALEQE